MMTPPRFIEISKFNILGFIRGLLKFIAVVSCIFFIFWLSWSFSLWTFRAGGETLYARLPAAFVFISALLIFSALAVIIYDFIHHNALKVLRKLRIKLKSKFSESNDEVGL